MIVHTRLYACRFCDSNVLWRGDEVSVFAPPPPVELPEGWHVVWGMLCCAKHKLVIVDEDAKEKAS